MGQNTGYDGRDAARPAGQKQVGLQAPGQKRKSITFAELTDIVLSRNIVTQDDLWREAKIRKMDGDESLWNRCGED